MEMTKINSYPLEQIRIASPCTADWEKMAGDDRARFCGECKKNVYNLSAMSRQQAEKLMLDTEGKICVMFYKRHDGTVLTQDCPVGWRKVVSESRKRAALARAACISVFASALGLAGCGPQSSSTNKPPARLTGEVCVPTPSPTPVPPIREMGEAPAIRPTPHPIKDKPTLHHDPNKAQIMGGLVPAETVEDSKPEPLMGSPVPAPLPTPTPTPPPKP
jgi:hypothetical protein